MLNLKKKATFRYNCNWKPCSISVMYGNMKEKLNRNRVETPDFQFCQKQLVIEVRYTDFWNSSSYSNRILKILFFSDIWYLSWQSLTQQFHCFMHFPLVLWKESKFVLFIYSHSLSSCHLLCRKKDCVVFLHAFGFACSYIFLSVDVSWGLGNCFDERAAF